MRFLLVFNLLAPLFSSLTYARIDADADDLNQCLKSAGVPVDSPGSSDWNNDILPFNNKLPYTPAAVAIPTTVSHVQSAVSCAAKTKVKVSAKGGGHSYASFGLGGENGHLVIDVNRMYQVTVDSNSHIATIQAGARLGHVAASLYSQGGRAISHGTCTYVGLSGHSLHGGFGFSSHTHGLALDWMVGATIVLANSTVVNCSSTENPDLFWALRGAGSSYGIVTSFRFNTFAVPAQVTVFSINLSWGSAADMVKAWAAYQNFVQTQMPAELNMRIFMDPWFQAVQGLYYGTTSQLQSAIQPLLNALGAGLSSTQTTDWMSGFAAYDNGQTLDVTSNSILQESFYAKSLATTALPTQAMQAAANYWAGPTKSVGRDWYLIIDAHGGNTSAVAAVPVNATAYPHRDKLFLYEFYDRDDGGNYPGPSAYPFLDGWVNSITSNLDQSQWGMYLNYADPSMNRTVAQQNYFRQNLPRLQKIKYAVDPQELFYFPQAIQAVQN